MLYMNNFWRRFADFFPGKWQTGPRCLSPARRLLGSVVEEYLRRAVPIAGVISIDKGFHMPLCPEDLMDLIAQLSRPDPMDDDHRRQMMGQRQIEIFLKGLEL